jgi:hypothetical protein
MLRNFPIKNIMFFSKGQAISGSNVKSAVVDKRVVVVEQLDSVELSANSVEYFESKGRQPDRDVLFVTSSNFMKLE